MADPLNTRWCLLELTCHQSVQRLGGRKTQSYSMTATSRSGSGGRGTLAAELERTLVVYLHSNSDPVYQNNMNYFIKHGILANDGCDYVLVMQGLDSPQVRISFALRGAARAPLNL